MRSKRDENNERRKRASAGEAATAKAGAVHGGRASEGMRRGDLGGIGVSEAGDDLGMSPGPSDLSKKVISCFWPVEPVGA